MDKKLTGPITALQCMKNESMTVFALVIWIGHKSLRFIHISVLRSELLVNVSVSYKWYGMYPPRNRHQVEDGSNVCFLCIKYMHKRVHSVRVSCTYRICIIYASELSRIRTRTTTTSYTDD